MQEPQPPFHQGLYSHEIVADNTYYTIKYFDRNIIYVKKFYARVTVEEYYGEFRLYEDRDIRNVTYLLFGENDSFIRLSQEQIDDDVNQVWIITKSTPEEIAAGQEVEAQIAREAASKRRARERIAVRAKAAEEAMGIFNFHPPAKESLRPARGQEFLNKINELMKKGAISNLNSETDENLGHNAIDFDDFKHGEIVVQINGQKSQIFHIDTFRQYVREKGLKEHIVNPLSPDDILLLGDLELKRINKINNDVSSGGRRKKYRSRRNKSRYTRHNRKLSRKSKKI